jgi:hypothetical protein
LHDIACSPVFVFNIKENVVKIQIFVRFKLQKDNKKDRSISCGLNMFYTKITPQQQEIQQSYCQMPA